MWYIFDCLITKSSIFKSLLFERQILEHFIYFQGISQDSDLNHRIHNLKELCEVVEKKEIEEVPTLCV